MPQETDLKAGVRGRVKRDIQAQPIIHHRSKVLLKSAEGFKVETTVTIMRPPNEVYHFWRDLENLPRFMRHLRSVTMSSELFSNWVARGPAGFSVRWESEIIEDQENRMISWQSTENSTIQTAGSVWFKPIDGRHGTEVRVQLKYKPPGGRLGAAVAKIFGEDPAKSIHEDLQRLKEVMETGKTDFEQIPTR